ncbi:MAG: type II secretion system GspH family protein [Lentisphaerales bacterium]|nr:type II secretion system GspH family protein [Lentisphaerales bacterium]
MNRKFTLIELLLVIAIIGILSSMLMPSLANARLKAMSSVCISNQRQVSIATQSYAMDNDEFGPTDNIDDHDHRWHQMLTSTYLPAGHLDKGASPVQACPNGLPLDAAWKSTIAMNSRITGKKQHGGETIQRSIAIASPSETCLLMDSYDAWRSTGNYNMNLKRLVTDGEPYVIARHLGKANMSYLDGSTKPKSVSFLLSTSDWNCVFWDPQQ